MAAIIALVGCKQKDIYSYNGVKVISAIDSLPPIDDSPIKITEYTVSFTDSTSVWVSSAFTSPNKVRLHINQKVKVFENLTRGEHILGDVTATQKEALNKLSWETIGQQTVFWLIIALVLFLGFKRPKE